MTCPNLMLDSGATRMLAMAFAVPSNYVCATPLVNTATVSGSMVDPNPMNNTSTSTRTVNCLAGDLGIVKAGSGTVTRGSNALLYRSR